MSVIEIKSKDDFDKLLQNKEYEVVAVQAHATWCGPCKAMSPIFENLSEEEGGKKMAFARFDTDGVEEVAKELGVRSIPAFYFFKDGENVNTIIGAVPKNLKEAVKTLAAK